MESEVVTQGRKAVGVRKLTTNLRDAPASVHSVSETLKSERCQKERREDCDEVQCRHGWAAFQQPDSTVGKQREQHGLRQRHQELEQNAFHRTHHMTQQPRRYKPPAQVGWR